VSARSPDAGAASLEASFLAAARADLDLHRGESSGTVNCPSRILKGLSISMAAGLSASEFASEFPEEIWMGETATTPTLRAE
jgi:hypothetical protein